MNTNPPPRQPLLTAPPAALLLAALIAITYPIQERFLADADIGALAVSWRALAEGRWFTLLTSLVLHGGWTHVLLNAAFALAFATPVTRRLCADGRGALAMAALYIGSGVLSGLGFAAAHWGDAVGAIGASGAVAGLMGASARLIDRPGSVSPIFSPSVLRLGGGWLVANLLLALIGSAPGLGVAGIAWEAHLAGFVAGLLLIGPTVRLADGA